jgi:hypothetical protein
MSIKSEKAIELRKKGLSLKEIATLITASKSSVSLWVRDVILTEEAKKKLKNKSIMIARNNVNSRNRNCLIKKEEARNEGLKLNLEDNLISAGLALYWAEGKKKSGFVGLVNCDPALVKLFVVFLIKKMKVDVNKIIFRVTTHDSLNLNEIENFWQKYLQLPKENIRKSILLNNKNSKKKNIHKYGMCSVEVYDVLILEKILSGIQKLSELS